MSLGKALILLMNTKIQSYSETSGPNEVKIVLFFELKHSDGIIKWHYTNKNKNCAIMCFISQAAGMNKTE